MVIVAPLINLSRSARLDSTRATTSNVAYETAGMAESELRTLVAVFESVKSGPLVCRCERIVSPAGRLSVTTTFCASTGEAFRTVIV